jgi:lipopolysaccharide/colanic/teichoic acid biosynthesis glycosyltransferase
MRTKQFQHDLVTTDTFYTRIGKRIFDLVASAIGLIALSPLLLVVSIAVKLSSKGPALFRQTRTGRFGKPFQIFKFRSMKLSSGETDSLLTASGDSRVTRLGFYLRKSKIDELPQLWNVLVGDMSMVGPRPEVPLYTAQYSGRQLGVLTAKPGITSHSIVINEEEHLAGRPDKEGYYLRVILPAKLETDLAYCQHIRFSRDLAIIFNTVSSLVLRPFLSNSPIPEKH